MMCSRPHSAYIIVIGILKIGLTHFKLDIA